MPSRASASQGRADGLAPLSSPQRFGICDQLTAHVYGDDAAQLPAASSGEWRADAHVQTVSRHAPWQSVEKLMDNCRDSSIETKRAIQNPGSARGRARRTAAVTYGCAAVGLRVCGRSSGADLSLRELSK